MVPFFSGARSPKSLLAGRPVLTPRLIHQPRGTHQKIEPSEHQIKLSSSDVSPRLLLDAQETTVVSGLPRHWIPGDWKMSR